MPNYPDIGGDSSKPILAANLIKGNKGDDAILAIAQPWHLALPCDYNGSNVDYTNKSVIIMIVRANSILAEGSTINGWSMVVDSETDCTVSITNLIADVDVIAANHASFKLKLSHSSYNDLYLRAKVSKIHKGQQGDQGNTGGTGGTGGQGIQGIQGDHGTGLVMVKKTIKVLPRLDNVAITQDGSTIQCETVADHLLVLGEYIHISDPVYGEVDALVTGIVSVKIWKMGIAYISDSSSGYAYSWWNFQAKADSNEQSVIFRNIFPLGAKLDELLLIITKGTNKIVTFDAGYKYYPVSGYAAYANSHQISSPPDLLMVNLWDPDRSGYENRPIFITNGTLMRVYLRARLYNSSWTWLNDFIGHEWNLIVSYKFFDFDEIDFQY